jgi:hypothetical protein
MEMAIKFTTWHWWQSFGKNETIKYLTYATKSGRKIHYRSWMHGSTLLKPDEAEHYATLAWSR